jgi:glycosyltransferase involved in cell wall biosynthesis
MLNPKSISLVFPLYKDKSTVKIMISKSLNVLKKTKKKFEIIIIDDGCPQNSGKIAQAYAKKNYKIKVFFHKKNKGYGAAIKTGIKKSKFDCIFLIDGDNEYNVNDLPRMLNAFKHNDLVITYRYKNKNNLNRIFISWAYNFILRFLFKTSYKDVSVGSRLLSKKLKNKIIIKSDTPFINAELAIKSKYCGYKVQEIGIQHNPRIIGNGSVVSIKNILLMIREIIVLFIHICLKKKLAR